MEEGTHPGSTTLPELGGPFRHASHVVAGLLLALALALVATLAVAPGVRADPPPGWQGPWLEVDPTHGRASDGFKAAYWFVTKGCPYTLVEWGWDGGDLGTSKIDPDTCNSTWPFDEAPNSEPGSHTITAVACGLDPDDRSLRCDSQTTGRVEYVVDPTPTLRLKPARGLATAGFSGTYQTFLADCPYDSARFSWDGKAIDPPVDMDGVDCSAGLDLGSAPNPDAPGKHVLSAIGCRDGSCDDASEARATYVILTPAKAEPTATPIQATPTPVTTPTAGVTPTPAVTATPAPTISPPPATTPSPSLGVKSETSPPKLPSTPLSPSPSPSSSPAGAIAIATGSPPAPTRGNPYVPVLATFVRGPVPGPVDAAVVTTNLFLTLMFVFLFALTAEIFNSTMDANRDEIGGWWARLGRGPRRALGPLVSSIAGLTGVAAGSRVRALAQAVVVLALLGLIYGFLSPDFGLNPESVVLFVSLVVGLGFMTYFAEGSSSLLAIRRYRANASVRLFWTAVAVAIVAVIVSRSVSFQPGLVYGFIASAVIVAPVALARRDDATLVLVPAFGLLAVSVLAWLLLAPVRSLADADGSWPPALAQTILAMIVIGGLEGLVVTMIPLRFMDGATVMGWSRLAWALTFGTVVFLWWQLLLNQDHAYAAAFEQTNVQVVLATLVVFVLTTGGLWSYFRFRPAPEGAEG